MAGVTQKISFVHQDARDFLAAACETMPGKFDIAFIDADKANYPHYWEGCVKLVRSGGLILVDDVLARGYVVGELDENLSSDFKQAVQAIREVNATIQSDDRVEMTLIPAWDGLTIARKL